MKRITHVRFLITLLFLFTFTGVTVNGSTLYGVPQHQNGSPRNLQAHEAAGNDSKKAPHHYYKRGGKHSGGSGHYLVPRKGGKRPIIIVKEREYVPEPAPRKEVVVKKRYIPVIRKVAPLRCSGDTAYYRNPETGELIIKYVTSAKRC